MFVGEKQNPESEMFFSFGEVSLAVNQLLPCRRNYVHYQRGLSSCQIREIWHLKIRIDKNIGLTFWHFLGIFCKRGGLKKRQIFVSFFSKVVCYHCLPYGFFFTLWYKTIHLKNSKI